MRVRAQADRGHTGPQRRRVLLSERRHRARARVSLAARARPHDLRIPGAPNASRRRDRIADIQGRNDDEFSYPSGVTVPAHVFRSLLAHEPTIYEYQVRQTPAGAELVVCTEGSVDAAGLARGAEQALGRLGCAGPVVTVRIVEQIPRLATGKLKRFVALAGPSEPAPGPAAGGA